MIFTRITLDNIFNFSNATLDLSIKRSLKHSPIQGEFLDDRPQIKFKKVCILSGANASGKTSLAKVLLHVSKNLTQPEGIGVAFPFEWINHKDKTACIDIEFITPFDTTLHRLRLRNDPKQEFMHFQLASIPILKSDSLTRLRSLLDEVFATKTVKNSTWRYLSNEQGYSKETLLALDKFKQTLSPQTAWYYLFSHTVDSGIHPELYSVQVLKNVLCTLDTSIEDVVESTDKFGVNGVTIRFSNNETIYMSKNGSLVPAHIERLSKGTYEGIQVADMLAAMISQKKKAPTISSTFYLDEKMAYHHTELETTLLNVMIQNLGRYDQLFYTTHNNDVIDMRLPIHSFVLLQKTHDQARFIQPENTFNKNDRSLLPSIQNDVFHSLPSVDKLSTLIENE